MSTYGLSRIIHRWIAGILLFVVAVGLVSLFTAGLARWLVNRNFPPVDIAELKQIFAADAAQSLAAIDQPTVLVSLSAATLSKSLTDAVDASLADLGARDAGDFGRVRVVAHKIRATPEDVQVRLAGELTVELVDYATVVTADVDLRVFGGFAGEAVVYRPALAGLEIRSIISAEGWATAFRLADLANAAISLALDNINGTIDRQRLAIDALASLRGHLLAADNGIEIAGRKVIILPPILKAASVLVTPHGLAVLAEVAPEPPPLPHPARSDVTNLTQDFVAMATSAFPDYIPGSDGVWVNPTALHRLVLADRYQPASADQSRAAILGRVYQRLTAMERPTFVLSVDGETLRTALAEVTARYADQLGTAGSGDPDKITFGQVTLSADDGVLKVSVPVTVGAKGISLAATVSGIVGFDLRGTTLRLTGAFGDITLEGVTLDDPRWEPNAVRTLAQTFVRSALPALNGLLSNVPVAKIPLAPLVMAGQPAKPMAVKIQDRTIQVFPPMVRDWTVLVDADGIALVAELAAYDAAAQPAEHAEVPPAADFAATRALFVARARAVANDFKPAQAGFWLAHEFVREWAQAAAAPADLTRLRQQALYAAAQALGEFEGPDVGAVVPAGELLKRLRELGREPLIRLAKQHIEVDPDRVTIALEQQELRLSVPFAYGGDGFIVTGRLDAIGLVRPDKGGIIIQPAIETFAIDDVRGVGNGYDLEPLVAGLNRLSGQLVPAINGLIEALPVSVQLPERLLAINLNADKQSGLRFEPDPLNAPPVQLAAHNVLVDPEGLRIMADIRSDVLPRRPQVERPPAASAFSTWRELFKTRWSTRLSWQDSPVAASVQLALDRPAAYARSALQLAAPRASMQFSESSSTPKAAVGALPAEMRCGGGCSRPSCDQNRACPPRTLCEPVTKLVTTPQEYEEKICKEISKIPFLGPVIKSTVCEVVKKTRNITKQVTTEVCKEVADTGCLATLNQCTAQWTKYDVCNNLRIGCEAVLQGFRDALAAIDFDKAGYVSTETGLKLAARAGNLGDVEIGSDLRRIILRPMVSADVSVDATINLEPRYSALAGCAPVRPIRIRDYQITLAEQRPTLAASIGPAPQNMRDNDPATLDLAATFDTVRLTGQAREAPLTKLAKDNPDLLATCPLAVAGVPLLESVSQVRFTKDAVVGTVRTVVGALRGDSDKAGRMARLLLDGQVVHDVTIPTLVLRVPPVSLALPGGPLLLRPELTKHTIIYTE